MTQVFGFLSSFFPHLDQAWFRPCLSILRASWMRKFGAREEKEGKIEESESVYIEGSKRVRCRKRNENGCVEKNG